jgi:hypothetical protein
MNLICCLNFSDENTKQRLYFVILSVTFLTAQRQKVTLKITNISFEKQSPYLVLKVL